MKGTEVLMRGVILICFVTAPVFGCNYVQLRRNSLQQASTVRDMQYAQVLDNVAMFHANPAAVPFCSLLDTGTLQVESTGSISGGLTWMPTHLALIALNPNPLAQRKTSGTWVLRPIFDPDKLRAMRCVYQQATGQEVVQRGCPGCDPHIGTTHKNACCNQCETPPPGWYCVGTWHQVPKHAKLVGNYADVYVWVLPGGEESLAQLTMLIYSIAMPYVAIPSGPSATPPGVPAPSTGAAPEPTEAPAEAPSPADDIDGSARWRAGPRRDVPRPLLYTAMNLPPRITRLPPTGSMPIPFAPPARNPAPSPASFPNTGPPR
jgi:hypothetical protein